MRFARGVVFTCVLACNGAVHDAGDAGDAGNVDDAETLDATSEAAGDAKLDAVADVAVEAATDDGGACAYSIVPVDDAGVCHAGGKTLDCSNDPSFDHCYVAQLHELDGAAFVAMECFDPALDAGETVCCNGVNPAGVNILIFPQDTCCPGPLPDGGMAACASFLQCTPVTGGWGCQ